MQTSLFDITANYSHNHENSVAANESIKEHKQLLRAQVIGYIYSRGLNGATSDEVEQALQLPHQTVSARLSEAKALSLVVDSGMRRKTRSGRAASVLVYKGLIA